MDRARKGPNLYPWVILSVTALAGFLLSGQDAQAETMSGEEPRITPSGGLVDGPIESDISPGLIDGVDGGYITDPVDGHKFWVQGKGHYGWATGADGKPEWTWIFEDLFKKH